MIVSRRVFLVTVGGTALAVLGGPIPASAAIRGIDHLVIMFKELEPAVQSYRDLGFAVSPGGEHPRETHNSLVALDHSGDGRRSARAWLVEPGAAPVRHRDSA
jgi:hypothetical protein